MGWANDALEKDLAKAGIFPIKDNYNYQNYNFDSDEFISDMEEDNPFPEKEQTKKEGDKIKIEAVKVMNSNSETSMGVFNITIGGIIKINYVRLYINKNTGEYFTLMPSFKSSSGRYNRYIEIDENLNKSIIKACLSDLNKKYIYYERFK